MSTIYVTRNGGGVINAVYANPQAFTTEPLDSTNPEVVAYLNPPVYLTKLTIINRLAVAGKLVAFDTTINLNKPALWRFITASRIRADNTEAISMCNTIGADPAVILAPE